MNSIGPDDLNSSSYFKIVCHVSGQFLGRIWTIISDIPLHFFELISSIKNIAAKCLFSSKSNEGQSIGSSTGLLSKNVKSFEGNDPELDLDDICFGLSGYPEKTKSKPPPILKLNDIEENEIEDDADNEEDPLDNMGAVNTHVNFGGTSPIDSIWESDVKITEEEVEEHILMCIQEIIQPARELLRQIKFTQVVHWSEYLDWLEKLDLELEGLKIYASKFIEIPSGHLIMQGAMEALAKKRVVIEKKLCVQIESHYTPNSAILQDGHCLFWSINDLLNKEETPFFYRKLAAEYIRNHTDKFDSAVKDILKLPSIRETITDYREAQGGVQSYCDKLEKKLNRPFTQIDYYCDCLENTNLWGGNTEVLALSEQLKVQILIFTQQKNSTWRFDAREGYGKFNDKPPLLLYYNGNNHYQSLIPKKTSIK